jgi:hypothetical protein
MLASLVQRCLTTTFLQSWSIPKAITSFNKANGVTGPRFPARIRALFNQPVHAGKYGGRNADLERLGGLPVKDQFEFVWLLLSIPHLRSKMYGEYPQIGQRPETFTD